MPSNNDPSKMASFRTTILTKCQKEFDTDFYQEINYDNLIEQVKACPDEQKKKELKELVDNKLTKAKRRYLGNIRFIGELYKLNMLTEGIMNDCIERLLKQESDEENIECLCRLLISIGKEVDKPNNYVKMESFFDKLDKIVKKKDCVTARIRFMIMHVIDLRNNKWASPRRKEILRRIEEIRRGPEEEQKRRRGTKVRQITNTGNDMLLGPGGGQGFAWNKSKPAADSMTNAYSSTINSSATFLTLRNTGSFRGVKPQPGNMVNKIKEVRQITNTGNDTMLLGPGGGQGFAWNKSKPSADSMTNANSSTITSSASFSTSKPGSNQDFSNRAMSSTQRMSGSSNYALKNKQNLSETTSRGSMDSNKSNLI